MLQVMSANISLYRMVCLAAEFWLLSGMGTAAAAAGQQPDAAMQAPAGTSAAPTFSLERTEKQKKDSTVAVEVRWIMPKLSLTVNTGKVTPGARDTVNFRDTLGIKNSDVPEIKVTSGKFEFDYIRVRQSGHVHLADSFTYQGVTFTNVNVDSTLDLDYFALNWKQKLLEKNRLTLYGGTGLRIYHMYTSVEGTANPGVNRTASDELFRVAPTLNLGLQVYLDAAKKVDFFSDFAGMTMGKYGYLYDYEAGLRYKPQANFSISAGYRSIDMNADLSVDNDDRPMYRLRGPYFSLAYEF